METTAVALGDRGAVEAEVVLQAGLWRGKGREDDRVVESAKGGGARWS